MKTRKHFLFLTLLVLTLSSFALIKSASDDQVMIYGVVYAKQCNTEASIYYETKLVSTENLYQTKEAFKQELESEYANASRVRVSDAHYDFGKTASHICVISWTKTVNNCTYKVIGAKFGTSEQSALENAIKHKNTWAGSNAAYQIEDQLYW